MSRVAVIVLNYNYGRYLAACLDSIDGQTCSDLRIILIDDASTDNSEQVIDAFLARARREVELITKPKNRGPAHSYNLALSRLGPDDEYVAIVDADDTLYPTKLSTQAEALEAAGPSFAAVYSDVDERLEESGVVQRPAPRRLPADRDPIEELLSVHGGFIPLPSALIRADALRALKPLDERIRICDYPMWLQVVRHGRLAYHQHLVGTVRVHGSSMSRSEELTADKLRLLARAPRTPQERQWARQKGRRHLRQAAVAGQRLPIGAQVEYMVRTRDPMALIYGLLTSLPAVMSASLRIRHRLRRGRRRS